eukprot:1404676-Alexandrium_andersonii.AAC.1
MRIRLCQAPPVRVAEGGCPPWTTPPDFRGSFLSGGPQPPCFGIPVLHAGVAFLSRGRQLAMPMRSLA